MVSLLPIHEINTGFKGAIADRIGTMVVAVDKESSASYI